MVRKNRVEKIINKGIVSNHSAGLEVIKLPGEFVLIERGVPRSILMKCPCGCGDNLTVNLDPRAGPAWRLYLDREKATIYPSVWRESGCLSHFIVWNSKVFWCDYESLWDDMFDDPDFEREVYSQVTKDPIFYFDLAEILKRTPWETLQCCRKLTRSGKLDEGKGKKRGHFSRPTKKLFGR